MPNLIGLEAENFMSLGNVSVDWSASINAICGYNDSGKSALLKAQEILFYDSYANKQIKFIKVGAEYFRISNLYDDGVRITKYKYTSGKILWEMTKNDQMIYTNKVGNALTATDGVPEPIQRYQRVLQDPFTHETLNVRKKTDKLFLIHTTGGENYNIFSSVLQSDTLATAVKAMNSDRNKLTAELNEKRVLLNAKKIDSANMVYIPDEELDKLDVVVKKTASTILQKDSISVVKENFDKYSEIVVWGELNTVDIGALTLLTEMQELREVCKTVIWDELGAVNIERLLTLVDIVNARKGLDVQIEPEVFTISIDRLSDTVGVATAFNDLYQYTAEVAKLDEQIKSATDEESALIKQNDLRVCPNCGSLVEEQK